MAIFYSKHLSLLYASRISENKVPEEFLGFFVLCDLVLSSSPCSLSVFLLCHPASVDFAARIEQPIQNLQTICSVWRSVFGTIEDNMICSLRLSAAPVSR